MPSACQAPHPSLSAFGWQHSKLPPTQAYPSPFPLVGPSTFVALPCNPRYAHDV